MSLLSRLTAPPSRAPRGFVRLFYDAVRRRLRLVDDAGTVSDAGSGGGGGVSAHPDLTGLAWTSSGHTGTGLAGFSGAGTAGNVSIGTGLDLSGGTLEVDTTTISTRAYAEGLAAAAEAAAEATAATLATAAQEAAEAASQPADADLSALSALTTTGMLVRTGTATYALRQLQAGSGVTITEPDGVADNPTIFFAGGTGQDDDPTSAYTISITPASATLVSRDGGITVRGAAAGNTADYRATGLSGATGDFFSASMNNLQTGWNYTGDVSFKLRLITGSSIAATCRYKMGLAQTGLTSVDAETAGRAIAIFRFLTGAGHTTWHCYSQNGSGSVDTDTGVTVSANTEYLLEVRINDTETKFYIDGSLVVTHSTYQPTTTTEMGFQAGVYAAARTIYIVGARYTLIWGS